MKMIDVSLNKLKLIAKNRGMKGYKSMSKNELIKILSKPDAKITFSKIRIKKIRKEISKLRDIFSEPKIKVFRRSIYEIENRKNLRTRKTKEIKKSS